ncbi:hypothetical protein FJU08_16625 [Martelella alba]|uniref:Uncharacterized protein n=1 Tax=Martelella alba TaxID=2590451 RepID=A0A506U246_9HYPH|nr:hypothetical protein [Martelella alba]TPW28442.1 hypothetical protein FJU08_16625 [Martelella alba]
MSLHSVPTDGIKLEQNDLLNGEFRNQIIRESYLYLHWNGILTQNGAEREMETFGGHRLRMADIPLDSILAEEI